MLYNAMQRNVQQNKTESHLKILKKMGKCNSLDIKICNIDNQTFSGFYIEIFVVFVLFLNICFLATHSITDNARLLI